MTVPEEEPKREAPWDKCWVFLLAILCVLSLVGLGTWGRMRMLEDDIQRMHKDLQDETLVHEKQEMQLRNRLRHKGQVFSHLRRELQVTKNSFKKLNSSLQSAKAEYVALKSEVKDVKSHIASSENEASERPSHFLSECHGVTLPHGYEFVPEGEVIFPHDIAADTTGLHALLQANDSFGSLYNVTLNAERARLFTRPTFPWAQYTWLQALLERPRLRGNFTEWGVGEGGSMMFLAGLARLRDASIAGFDAWDSRQDAAKHQDQFAKSAQECGLSVPKDAQLFDLSSSSIVWPEAGRSEQLAFTHIDSNDYDTTLGILKVVYPSTADGGIFAIDNFFHPSGGSKRAVEDFFKENEPGKMPVIHPVFPGLSVLVFKGLFANATDSPNGLDGNQYSFRYIKGQPELLQSMNRSVSLLSDIHRNVMVNPNATSVSICWLSLALHNAKGLRDLILSAEDHAEDFEAADIFRFMAGSVQFTAHEA